MPYTINHVHIRAARPPPRPPNGTPNTSVPLRSLSARSCPAPLPVSMDMGSPGPPEHLVSGARIVRRARRRRTQPARSGTLRIRYRRSGRRPCPAGSRRSPHRLAAHRSRRRRLPRLHRGTGQRAYRTRAAAVWLEMLSQISRRLPKSPSS